MGLTPASRGDSSPNIGRITTTVQTGSLDLNDLDKAVVEQVSAARIAQQNVSTLFTKGKTVAEVAGQRTISGWTSKQGYVQKTREVMARARKIGYQLPPHSRDQKVKGRYFASHAEPQAYEVAPDKPIGIHPYPMCNNCREYFRYLAQQSKKRLVVADFKATRVFYSDGTVAVVRSDDSVIVYPSDTKAKELN